MPNAHALNSIPFRERMTAKLQELLNASDEELFSGGACHIYAVELKKNWWPELTLKHAGIQHVGVEPTPGQAIHVYAALGRYKVDVRGVVNETEYLKSEGYVARETSIDDLMKVDPKKSSATEPRNQWQHHLNPEFVSCASERARRHIAQHIQEWRSILESKD
jgi:hypothetical protein